MTAAEIKALLAEAHDDVRRYECPKYSTSCKMMTAIETMLAREADAHKRELCLHAAGCETNELFDTLRAKILEVVDNFDPTWPEDGLRKIRAILNPENET